MEQEIWKDIEGYEGLYKISSFGNVFSVKRNKIMLFKVHGHKGYKKIQLNINKQKKYFRISRLVAKHFIPNPENKKLVDHIDRNPSNNHISNLRWATYTENLGNQLSRKGSSSKYKGVFFHKATKKWQAEVRVDKVKKYLGSFTCEKEAALVYNKKAKELFGEFALLNDIEEDFTSGQVDIYSVTPKESLNFPHT
jgi:hypothetical protein